MKTVGAQHRWEVQLGIPPFHDFYETVGLLSGLSALASAGEIALRIFAEPTSDVATEVVRLSVTDLTSGTLYAMAIDVSDRGDRFDVKTLGAVDTYFKTTYRKQFLTLLPLELVKKVQPAGLTFACCVRGTRQSLTYVTLASFWSHWKALGIPRLGEGLRRLGRDLIQLQGILDENVWERRPDDVAEDQVVFQTRVWPPERDPTIDRREVNRERVELIRALRSAFGPGDHIGLLHTKFARQTATDFLTSRKVSKREYAKQLRTSLVAVNSHGLDGSAGFKIGESLAAGTALVSQRFCFELPEPLVEDINYLPYETSAECVEQCRRLLADRDLAERMRAANLEYYRRHVRPDALARHLLSRLAQ